MFLKKKKSKAVVSWWCPECGRWVDEKPWKHNRDH